MVCIAMSMAARIHGATWSVNVNGADVISHQKIELKCFAIVNVQKPIIVDRFTVLTPYGAFPQGITNWAELKKIRECRMKYTYYRVIQEYWGRWEDVDFHETDSTYWPKDREALKENIKAYRENSQAPVRVISRREKIVTNKGCEHIKIYEETKNQGWWNGKMYCSNCMPNKVSKDNFSF